MLRTVLATAALAGAGVVASAGFLAAPAFAQEVEVETAPPGYVAPYGRAPVIIERRYYESRPVIVEPQPRVYEEQRLTPPAPIVDRRTYTQPIILDGEQQCRIVIRREIDAYGDTVDRRVRVCE
ncbi:hypothetical protein [Terrarubrum flagellatum]|uniref:hypothetical protein n=1 Tax=Terrirubrum flagellatum TaxID=2895980 RepID=UPI0031450EC1